MTDFESQAEGRVGQLLKGRYRLERVLGIGGMAAVYLATHRNRKRFAIKILHREISLHENLRARFLREGYVANSVNHPGALAVLDDDTAEDGAAFLVMELLEGESLEALLEKRGQPLPVSATLALADQLLDVLRAAHENGIVHRDIKPANLFLTEEGALKVLDFGIARLREAATAGPGMGTQVGTTLGTPAFMAPEQALGAEDIDGQTDLWAVGATLFTMLSGALVHEAANPRAMLISAATQQARSLASVAPGLPPGVVALVDGALAFDRAGRWPTAAIMKDAVRRAHLEAFGTPLRSSSAPASSRLLRTEIGAHGTSDVQPWAASHTKAPHEWTQTSSGLGAPPRPGGTEPAPGADLLGSPRRTTTTGGVVNRLATPRSARSLHASPLAWGAMALMLALLLGGTAVVVKNTSSPVAGATASGVGLVIPASAPVVVTSAARAPTSLPPLQKLVLPDEESAAPAPPPPVNRPRFERAEGPVVSPRPALPIPTSLPIPALILSPPPVPNCDPPYTIDSAGHHLYKAECT